MKLPQISLRLHLILISFAIALCTGASFFIFIKLGLDDNSSILLAMLLSLAVAFVSASLLGRSLLQHFKALEIGLLNFKDNEFGVSIVAAKQHELQRLAELYNQAGDSLRKSRQHLHQRELLLDQVIQHSPLAMVLTDSKERVLYSNASARELFNRGKPIDGLSFSDMLKQLPEAIHQAVASKKDGLLTLEQDGENHTYHLSQGQFAINAQTHSLYLFKQMTKELNRQEVAIWKKIIRLVSHELNNAIAPISSMAHSAQLILAERPDERLHKIFDTIETRAKRLGQFIEGYSQYARLPLPNKQQVTWHEYTEQLRQQITFHLSQPLPARMAYFDPGQIEQVLINLLKNAHESGSNADQIELAIQQQERFFKIDVLDRGQGMSQQVLDNALLPFYSTKQTGTGLGLALCREIIEAHDGRMTLHNRRGGGLRVSLWLPL